MVSEQQQRRKANHRRKTDSAGPSSDEGSLQWRTDGSISAVKPPILLPVAATEARLRELIAGTSAGLLVRRHATSVASHFKNGKAAAAAERAYLDITARSQALMAAVTLFNDITARRRVQRDRDLTAARSNREDVLVELRSNSEQIADSTDRAKTGKLIAARDQLHARLVAANALIRSLSTDTVAFIEDPDGVISAALHRTETPDPKSTVVAGGAAVREQQPQPARPPPPWPHFHGRCPQLVWVSA